VQGPWPLLLLLAGAIVVVLVQTWRLGRHRAIGLASQAAAEREGERRAAAHARSLRAVDGEAGAFALLERAGYAVLERHVPGSWTVHADGEPVTFGLRADYLVARRGRRYIAEVKTGRVAPRLSHGPTRRQLLEYSAAFDVQGVILVDADVETITHVEVDLFGDRASRRPRWPAPAALAVVAVFLFSAGVFVGSAIRAGNSGPPSPGIRARWLVKDHPAASSSSP
jgi:hypothetical protein